MCPLFHPEEDRGEGKDAMRLELHWSQVETFTAGTTTRLVGKALNVNLDELLALLEADVRL